MDHAEVKVVTLPVKQWIEQYCRPEQFAGACEACPDYGRVWSCPPGIQSAKEIFAPFSRVHIIGMKVVYRAETRAAATTAEKTERLRAATYGKAKRILLESLLELEKAIPGSWSLAAGRCELCDRCCRIDGLPCRMPERMRYSFTGVGFDLMRIAREVLELELLWNPGGLPEYNVAIAALLERKGMELEQTYLVENSRPWKLFQQEVTGVLQQMGCAVRQKNDAEDRLEVTDLATGDTYELVFDPVGHEQAERDGHQLGLENKTGSGRRLTQFSKRLQDCFPELTPASGKKET